MPPFVLLLIAIGSEVFGSSMLKQTNGFRNWLPTVGVILGMGTAFYCLSLALLSIPLGTAYAIWSGLGTALTAAVGILFYKESIHLAKTAGLLLIIAGVVVLRAASSSAAALPVS